MKNVRAKINIPLVVTEEAVQFAERWVSAFVAPGELPVLKVYLLEIASVQGVAESDKTTPINISTVFVSSSVDLVKITINQPLRSVDRLLGR